MNMPMCSRCKKNIAVVFITKIEGPDKTTQEGLCLKCARELGVKPLDEDKLAELEEACYGMFTLIFPMTLPVVLLQMLVAWFAMMASSGYCIALILHARRQGKISTGTAVRQVISQFIYVVDVISLFFIRKTVNECETAQ